MAYAEVYTGLQTGAIDGQDNPLPNVENMKFYEVMSQIVLTSHLVGYDLLDGVEQGLERHVGRAAGEASRRPPTRRSTSSTEKHLKREKELADHFKDKGLNIYEPDVAGVPQPRAGEVSRVRSRQELAEGPPREDQRALIVLERLSRPGRDSRNIALDFRLGTEARGERSAH